VGNKKSDKKEKIAKSDKPPSAKPKKPSEKQVLAEMKRLGANGIAEVHSRLISDKLGLDKESGRDQVRRIVRKLEKAGKVEIGQKEVGKRRQYVYKLVSPEKRVG